MMTIVKSFIAGVSLLYLPSNALADGAPAPAASSNPLGAFLPMILVFVIFYFLMIRPQAKQRKEHQNLLSNLKKGDEVITAAGIHGKIYAVMDAIATVEIADNVRIKMDKQQIATIKTSSTN